MESMYKLLQVRRSHRKFTEQAVEQEKIDAILRNALMSPAGKSLNPWEFIVVQTKKCKRKCLNANHLAVHFWQKLHFLL